MMGDVRLPRLAVGSAVLGGLAYYGALALWLVGGASSETEMAAALQLAALRPGLWGLAYLLQSAALLLWTLVPLGVWARYRLRFPNLAVLSLVVGAPALLWGAQANLAKAGGMEFLSRLHASGDPTVQIWAELLATWTLRWLFGGAAEAVGSGLAFGVWVLLVGLLLRRAGMRRAGGAFAVVGGVGGASLLVAAPVSLISQQVGRLIAVPGLVAVMASPLVLAAVAWLVSGPGPGDWHVLAARACPRRWRAPRGRSLASPAGHRLRSGHGLSAHPGSGSRRNGGGRALGGS